MIHPVEFYGKDKAMPKKLKYCEDCVSWKLFTDETMHTRRSQYGCRYVMAEEVHHPVRPQEVYGDYKVLNKDNDCPHFKDKNEGMGLAGEGRLLKDDERCKTKAGG